MKVLSEKDTEIEIKEEEDDIGETAKELGIDLEDRSPESESDVEEEEEKDDSDLLDLEDLVLEEDDDELSEITVDDVAEDVDLDDEEESEDFYEEEE